MNNRLFQILLIIFILCLTELSFSQNDSAKVTQPAKVQKVNYDSLAKSPTGAVLRSLVFPGWGQYYVESYWKVPVFVVGWGTLAFFIYDNHTKYKSAADEYSNYSGTDATEKNYLFRKREYFRDYRDMNIFFLAGVYIISAVDAYVGANLYEFNVDDNLTLESRINYYGNPEIGVRVNF